MNDREKLGRNLKLARVRAGLTQAEAGDKVGLSKQAISLQERGESAPTEENLAALATAYGTSKPALRYGEDASPNEFQYPQPRPENLGPRVMQGLPKRIRVWMQEFLLEITKAGANEREVDAARRLLESPELYTLYSGGEPKEMSEDDWMLNLEASAAHIRNVLKRRGRKFPPAKK